MIQCSVRPPLSHTWWADLQVDGFLPKVAGAAATRRPGEICSHALPHPTLPSICTQVGDWQMDAEICCFDMVAPIIDGWMGLALCFAGSSAAPSMVIFTCQVQGGVQVSLLALFPILQLTSIAMKLHVLITGEPSK